MLKITTQTVHTWKKRIQRSDLKGSTYFCNQGKNVWVSASRDHQAICQAVLGPPDKPRSLESYILWDKVSASVLVELLYKLDSA